MSDDAANRPKPRALNLPAKLAAFLTTLHARPDASIEVGKFVWAFRATLPARQHYQAGRKAVESALEEMAIAIGRDKGTKCIVGYSLEPAPTLTVNEAGKIVEVA
jgi:hypothetical protein